jgi:hypothetical protein
MKRLPLALIPLLALPLFGAAQPVAPGAGRNTPDGQLTQLTV